MCDTDTAADPTAQLERENQRLRAELARSEKTSRHYGDMLECARAVLRSTSFSATAREIFDICQKNIGSQSGYVALLNENGDENEVLFLEAGGLACTVDPELPMPIRGLRSVAYRTRQPVYDNDFMRSQWVAFMPAGHVALHNVLFAPIVLDDTAVGLIGIANKPGGFTDDDARLAATYGEIVAIALQNSRTLDQLRHAVANVKTLHGLLPICAACKKIRDDQGYWSQIEQYLKEHSDATFTHSLCPECMAELYPEFTARK